MFLDDSYYNCVTDLAEMGMETTPEEYDLIRDILRCAEDAKMGADMDKVQDIEPAERVLQKHGYYHITKDFLSVLLQYSSLISQESMFTEEELGKMEKLTFQDRCRKNIVTMSAISVITALRYGIHNSMEVPYLIAIAGGVTMIRERMAQA